ncbi:hypothetical protein AKJ09_08220 [Labilithrix luteola]|uniref:Uncharacterized protein n=1 Tax=Labilithrix luteola TaxID=1391654 RepID=A0A0K1Q7B6_9BACT|nr:hypothetical protein AKJ09_08220 [Labilithrix luteola]
MESAPATQHLRQPDRHGKQDKTRRDGERVENAGDAENRMTKLTTTQLLRDGKALSREHPPYHDQTPRSHALEASARRVGRPDEA